MCYWFIYEAENNTSHQSLVLLFCSLWFNDDILVSGGIRHHHYRAYDVSRRTCRPGRKLCHPLSASCIKVRGWFLFARPCGSIYSRSAEGSLQPWDDLPSWQQWPRFMATHFLLIPGIWRFGFWKRSSGGNCRFSFTVRTAFICVTFLQSSARSYLKRALKLFVLAWNHQTLHGK